MAMNLQQLAEAGHIAADWAEALAPVEGQLAELGRFLNEERASGQRVLPAGDRILAAFQRPLADVRVLIVGQDPYPTPGHPIGLSFATAPDPAVLQHASSLADAPNTHTERFIGSLDRFYRFGAHLQRDLSWLDGEAPE